MALPSDTTPLRRAVIAALTGGTGKPRAMALDGLPLFQLLPPAAAMARPARVQTEPGCWVFVVDHQVAPDAVLHEMSTERREQVRVEIVVSFWSGNPEHAEEHATQIERIERDRQRVISALCYPGALQYDDLGNETGLDGDSLPFAGYRSKGPEPLPMTADSPRVLTVTHSFVATVSLLQSST